MAVVAFKTGRHFLHIDVSPQYCQIAEKRLEAARIEQELPLSVGRIGKVHKVGQLFHIASNEIPARRREKLAQSRLLETKASYANKDKEKPLTKVKL